jgi:Yip1-like protein
LETPRTRFRAFLDAGDRRWIVPALAGSGLAHISSQIVVAFTDEETHAKIAAFPTAAWYAVLVFWPVFTVLCGWLNALLLRWTGRFLGGAGTVRGLLAALAWSVMPVALGAPLIAGEAIALLRGAASPEKAGGLSGIAGHVVNSVFGVTVIMSIFRLVISVSEAQRFNKRKAVANFALAVLPFFLVTAAFYLAMH